MITQKELYNKLTDLLTHKQFRQIMGGSMKFIDKAYRAKKVSKSKHVHLLADQIISFNKAV